MTKRTQYLAFTLTALAVAAPGLAAAQDAPDGLPVRVTEEMVENEAGAAARDAYLESRRKNPADPTFDSALARLRAVQDRQAKEAALGSANAPLGVAAAWVNIGPAPINFGQTPTSNPRIPSDVSGRVSAIAIDSTGVVYAGGVHGGVWKSIDDGATWTPLGEALASLAIGSIAVDPQDDQTIWVGTGEGNSSCDSYGGVGVYKSSNGGASWSGPFGTAQFGNRGIPSIAVDRTNSNHILAASASGIFGLGCQTALTLPSRGIYESTDGGATWTERTPGNNRASVVLQDPVTATTWWGAMWYTGNGGGPDGGFVKSIDNGATWVQQVGVVTGLPALSSSWGRSWVTARNESGTTHLYLANTVSSGSVYRSTDAGATWTQLANATGYCGGQCFYDMPIYVDPGSSDILYTGGAGNSTVGVPPYLLMRSDNATSGTPTFADKVRSGDASTALHADVHVITSVPGSPAEIWTGNDGGVWRSTDRGDNWIDVNNNLALTQFSGCDLHPWDRDVVYGGSQDNGTEGRPGTDNWKHLDFGDGGFALMDQRNPNNLVHTYFNQTNNLVGVGFTTGGFATTMGNYLGSFASANGIAISDRVLFYAPLHLDRGQSDTLYYGTHRLWRAPSFFVNGGLGGEFSAVNAGQDLTGGNGALSAIETFANPGGGNADLIYTGSNNGHVFRTTNATGAANWTEVDVGGSAIFVSDIAIDPKNSQVVYQSRSGFAGAAGLNVRKSTDGGATWNPAGSGIPDIPVNALVIDPYRDGWVWAGTDAGVYLTQNGGASWAPYSTGLPNSAVFDMKANFETYALVACTHGRGAFRLDLAIFASGFEKGDFTNWSNF